MSRRLLLLGMLGMLVLSGPCKAMASSTKQVDAMQRVMTESSLFSFLMAVRRKDPSLAETAIQVRIIELLEENNRLLREIKAKMEKDCKELPLDVY